MTWSWTVYIFSVRTDEPLSDWMTSYWRYYRVFVQHTYSVRSLYIWKIIYPCMDELFPVQVTPHTNWSTYKWLLVQMTPCTTDLSQCLLNNEVCRLSWFTSTNFYVYHKLSDVVLYVSRWHWTYGHIYIVLTSTQKVGNGIPVQSQLKCRKSGVLKTTVNIGTKPSSSISR